MTTAATSRYWLSTKSAEAWVVRHSPSAPGKDQVTSPLPYQSNSGPTPSSSSAMNPSRDTTAPMTVLAMISSFRLRSRVRRRRVVLGEHAVHQLAAAGDADLLEGRLDVVADGVRRQVQLGGDLAGAEPAGD